MNKVEPIRNLKKLEAMKEILHSSNLRDYCCFVLGIDCGLNISEILRLCICDVLFTTGEIRESVNSVEGKALPENLEFTINETAKRALYEYLETRKPFVWTDPLFKSRKKRAGGNAPITRISLYRSINAAATQAGIVEQIGAASMRKTFAYLALQSGGDLRYIQKILNHSEKRQTLKYIDFADAKNQFSHGGQDEL